jgi:hypothetical protein
LTKFPNAAGVIGKDSQHGTPLVEKYRAFVKQLLSELKTTPFETVQQEMFQVVHDLQQMFLKFQAHSHGEDQDSSSFDQNNNPSILNQQFPFDGQPPSPTLFSEETYSSPKYASSDSSYTNSSTTKSSIKEDLPSIMKAFDRKQHLIHGSRDPHWSHSERQLAHFQEHKPYVGPKLQGGLNNIMKKDGNNGNTIHHGPFQSSSQSGSPSVSTQSLQVVNINGKVMVATENGYQDMQQWLNSQTGKPISSKTGLATSTSPASDGAAPTSRTTANSQSFAPFSKPFPINVSWPFAPGQVEKPLNTVHRNIKPSPLPTKPSISGTVGAGAFQDNYNDMMNFSL